MTLYEMTLEHLNITRTGWPHDRISLAEAQEDYLKLSNMLLAELLETVREYSPNKLTENGVPLAFIDLYLARFEL